GYTLLGAAVGENLFHRHPDACEGQMSRWRARLVSRKALARAMEQRELLPHCRVGAQVQEPWPDSVKANLAESILAAIYLDGGWDAVRQAVAKLLDGFYDDVDTAPPPDVKNQLQQWALEHHKTLPDYSSERSGGSDHAPEFNCQVSVGGHSATGTGTSRRRAEAAAASALLSEVGVLE
nr:putative dsRNA-binding protein [Planctomycetota bacterium]